jgi:hypothetical protein
MKKSDKKMVKYFEWLEGEEKVLQKRPLRQISQSILPVLNLPILNDSSFYDTLLHCFMKYGYKGINLPLTPLIRNKINSSVWKKFPVYSAHGTSIKESLKSHKPYVFFLKQDLAFLDIEDPSKQWLINYDCYAGHLSKLNIQENFQLTQQENMMQICEELGLEINKEAWQVFIDKIIDDLAEVYGATSRSICIEIPGSKGWSMFPQITSEVLDYLILKVITILPNATLCLDIGHVLTWTKNSEEIKKVNDILKKYSSYFSMLHISSAGAWSKEFHELYKESYGDAPLWRITGLDLMLSVCEPEMLELLASVRNILKGKTIIEVSENRLRSIAIKDYFPQVNTDLIDDKLFFEDLFKQANIIGYV